MQQDYYGSLHREAQQGQAKHGGLELNTEISWAISVEVQGEDRNE